MIALLCFFLTLFASPFKSKSRLEAENAALRHQLIVLQRRISGRVQLTNGDRLFLVMLYQRRGPTINGFEDSSVSRQRRSDPSRHPARGPHRICAGPRRPSLPLLPNLVFSTHSPQARAGAMTDAGGSRANFVFGGPRPECGPGPFRRRSAGTICEALDDLAVA